ncbi:hypothetical protein CVD28_00170 [Bacillus sp. M6-12]|uniref:hypothetical protein n=1 Tax=Bacillus sp. M6-12 TaxID=2054166 RepID=UPI000C791321|nr:hypothetical protein [Bacillus sp. M6-12]PLS18851.1 hypothetical protein CVD28_00170 [Bacillus sp. M6-12]
MVKMTIVTKDDLFNMIAPIHVYQKADLMYEKEAKVAFKKLKEVRENMVIADYFGDSLSTLKERSVKNVDMYAFWRVYNRLFEEIVKEEFPSFTAGYDKYGAKCFFQEGQMLLDGDDYDCFPFYLDTNGLKGRLYDLSKEIA